MRPRLVILLGPTAVGKTDLSISLAQKFGSPVISCDSRQFFREMTIGTAVPEPDQLSAVKHYFIQDRSVTEPYSAGQYGEDALRLIRDLFASGHDTLLMTGGSGFYADAVCGSLPSLPQSDPVLRSALTDRLSEEGLQSLVSELSSRDPLAVQTIDTHNPARVLRALEVCISTGRPFSSFKSSGEAPSDFDIEKIGLFRPREELYSRINERVGKMLSDGLVEEARGLIPYRGETALQTVGYKEMFDMFDGLTTLTEAADLIRQHTRNYAKRQMTWFRRDQAIRWIDASSENAKLSLLQRH